MDSLTQLCLGAAVGYAVAGKKMGKKAILWGALAGTLPDLDFLIALPSSDDFSCLKYHRGFSHSLLFSALGPLCIAGLAKRVYHNWKSLAWIFFWGIFTHILLDCFTSWGTQVFWPLPYRVAWNSIFIIDPLYSVPLLIGLLGALLSRSSPKQEAWIHTALILSSTYLLLALGAKTAIHFKFKALFSNQELPVLRFSTRPTAFNILLWSTTAETKRGYYTAWVSLLDKKQTTKLHFVPKQHELSRPFSDPKSQALIAYTKGYYAVFPYKKGIIIHDLRYGLLSDPWLNEEAFVFSYYLHHDKDGAVQLEIHNPRPKNRGELLAQLWTRLKGI